MRPLRHDLRGLATLELTHRAIAIGLLVAIAVRSLVLSNDPITRVLLALAILFALLHLVLAFRLRAGQEPLRRALIALELFEGENEPARASHPYRSAPQSKAAEGGLACARNPPSSSSPIASHSRLAVLP